MTVAQAQATHVPQLQALWKEAFGDSDAFLQVFFQTAFSPARCRLITENGRVLAALYWFDCLYRNSPIAYLYAIATKQSHRGQGLCRKLMEDTHRHLAALGYRGALLVPASPSLFDYYQKLGYGVASCLRELSCKRAEEPTEPIQLTPLSAHAYAKKRRALLPPDAVLQEGEGLAFLQTCAAFYEADGCLLAARADGTEPMLLELLGDTRKAPYLLSALGIDECLVRTAADRTESGEGYGGHVRPFTAFLPLGDTLLPPPRYFAFAFD